MIRSVLAGLIIGIAAWLSACVSTQTIPLGADQASRDFLLGEWEGTYEWPSDAIKNLKRVTLSIRSVAPDGTVRAVLQLFDSSNTPATRAPEQLTGDIDNGRLLFRNAGGFNLSRVGADRLAGDAQIGTRGGVGGPRMDKIEFQFRRVGGPRSSFDVPLDMRLSLER